MQLVNDTVFEGTASGYSPWFDIGHLNIWSLHITGLEAGGAIVLWTSNEGFMPTTAVADPNAVMQQTITSTGAPLLVQGTGIAHWLQLQKTAGGGATATQVNLFGQIPY